MFPFLPHRNWKNNKPRNKNNFPTYTDKAFKKALLDLN